MTSASERAPSGASGGATSEAAHAADGLLARLKAFEGQPSGPASRAPDPVNQAMIRHWVEAMGDENPVYVDAAAARANGFPGVIAPPTMLQAWVMRGYRASAEASAARRAHAARSSAGPVHALDGGGNADDGEGPPLPALDLLYGLLDSAGFTSVVATNCEQQYGRPLTLGDELTVSSVIESVSPEKATALGSGHFVTTRLDFTDQVGEPVAMMRFRVLRFRPAGGGAANHGAPAGDRERANQTEGEARASGARRPRPPLTQDNAFFFEGARAGKLLVQRCASCATLRHPPRPSCPECRSFEWNALEASGRGVVYSYVVVHHPEVPGFDYPLPIALVELEEGTRLVADLVDVDPADVHVGMAVECDFVAVDEDLTLPVFRPARVHR